MERSESSANGPALGSQRAIFALLWLIWAGTLAAAIWAGNSPETDFGKMATALRMASSVVLVVTATFSYFLFRGSIVEFPACCIAVGMVLGAVGDFFNAGLLNFIPLPDPILGGIAAFGLGHIAYIAGCIAIAKRASLTSLRAFAIAILIWQLIGLVGWYVVVYQGTHAKALVWPSLPYSALLAGTAGMATGLAIQNRRFIWLAAGGGFFLASDLILACGLFRSPLPHQTDWVWLTYGPAQMLIVFSVLSVAAVLAGVGRNFEEKILNRR